MRIQLLNHLLSLYRRVVTSIGFWPTVISCAFSLMAVILLSMDTEKPTTMLLEKAPGLVIKDGDTARVLLSTVVAGMLSLTVFSFTMVMSQLNRAASNYSPRLLPGLVSTKRHQVVLGIFLGTITFSLFVLINIEPSDDSYSLPGLAVLVSIFLSLICLALFIYFIHSISRAIQVTNILMKVATDTRQRMKVVSESCARSDESPSGMPDCPYPIEATSTGYFCGCNQEALRKLTQKHDLAIRVATIQGAFILENTQPVYVSREIESEVKEEILSCLVVSEDQQIDQNYLLGFKQITEVAVRAMSPGTNDPGTALTAIDHLTHLLALRMEFDDEEVYQNSDGKNAVAISVVTFAELLYSLHAPLRLYCRHDVIIVMKLLKMFEHLVRLPNQKNEHHEAILDEMESLLNDASNSLHSESDKERVKSRAQEIRDAAA